MHRIGKLRDRRLHRYMLSTPHKSKALMNEKKNNEQRYHRTQITNLYSSTQITRYFVVMKVHVGGVIQPAGGNIPSSFPFPLFGVALLNRTRLVSRSPPVNPCDNREDPWRSSVASPPAVRLLVRDC